MKHKLLYRLIMFLGLTSTTRNTQQTDFSAHNPLYNGIHISNTSSQKLDSIIPFVRPYTCWLRVSRYPHDHHSLPAETYFSQNFVESEGRIVLKYAPLGDDPNFAILIKSVKGRPETWRAFLYQGRIFFAHNIPDHITGCVLDDYKYEQYFRPFDQFGHGYHPSNLIYILILRPSIYTEMKMCLSVIQNNTTDISLYKEDLTELLDDINSVELEKFCPFILRTMVSNLTKVFDWIQILSNYILSSILYYGELIEQNSDVSPKMQNEEVDAGECLAKALEVIGSIAAPLRSAIEQLGYASALVSTQSSSSYATNIPEEEKRGLIRKAAQHRSVTGRWAIDITTPDFSYGAQIHEDLQAICSIPIEDFSPDVLASARSRLTTELTALLKVCDGILKVLKENKEIRSLDIGIDEVENEKVFAGRDLANILETVGSIAKPFTEAVQNIGTGICIVNNT